MICGMVGLAAQRSTISRLGPLRRKARSGMSRTRCWLFSPRRQPGARRGRLFSSGCIVSSSRFPSGLEGPGGGPAGIDVGKIEGVQLSPEDVALGAQRGMGQILFRARTRVSHDPGESKFGVFRSLRETAGKIVEAAGEPGVVLAEAIHAQNDQFFGEEFGEGRSHGFEVRASGYEINVGLHGETRGGKNAVAAERVLAREAGSFDEPQPFFNAAGRRAVPIVIEDALAPGQAEAGIFAAREDGRIFDRYATLIGVTIEGPGLKLATREPAIMHQQMKRMLVMVALLSNGMETSDERGFRDR